MLHYLKQNVVHIDVLLAKSGKINFTIYAKGQKNIQGHFDVVLFRQKYKKTDYQPYIIIDLKRKIQSKKNRRKMILMLCPNH